MISGNSILAFGLCILTCFFPAGSYSQVTFNPGVANFLTLNSGETDSIEIVLTNGTPTPLLISGIHHFDSVFSFSDTAFALAPGGNTAFTVYVNASHNLDFKDFALFQSTTHPNIPYLTLFASIEYPDSYYSSTQNLSHEELKTSLRQLLSSNAQQFTYIVARDKMYMEIDNQMVNGQGASQNTIECVYTGKTVAGYANRTDAQSSGNFNTEHAFPQSFFGSALPMVSDIHHLFPTHAPANSERGNNPYGIVSSPSWQDGGSKSNGSLFEPRDSQKGRSARAVMYFVTRYSDTTGFAAPQENLMRQWAKQFPPDFTDSMRNEMIFLAQNNRNPFVDHPGFPDRIASLCTNDSGYLEPVIHLLSDLQFGSVSPGDTLIGLLHISNQGSKRKLMLSGFSTTGNGFFILGSPPTSISPEQVATVSVGFSPPVADSNCASQLTFTSDDPVNPSLTVLLNGNSFPVSATNRIENQSIRIYPVPAHDEVMIAGLAPERIYSIQITDCTGREIRKENLSGGNPVLSVDGLAKGIYLMCIGDIKKSTTNVFAVW